MDEWIFQHGWGWDANFWINWKLRFPSKNFKFIDRGYFKNPHPITHFTSETSRKILVCHSFGLHLVPQGVLKKANILILFACFFEFVANLEFQKLAKLLGENPTKGLKRHFINQSYPHKPQRLFPLGYNKELLMNDLNLMKKAKFDLANLDKEAQLLIFQGGKDRVVPSFHSEGIHQRFPQSQYFYFPEESHLLPYSNPKVFDLITRNFDFH